MKKFILILAIFLTACAQNSHYSKPIFSDEEKVLRAEKYDDWFSAHLPY